MKKTYTTTYCEWNSYGSVLQAIGLQQTLKKMGTENSLLKQTSSPSAKYKHPKLSSVRPVAIIKWLYNLLIVGKTAKRYCKNLDFISKNVDIEYIDGYDKILQNPPKADCFIAGSDQIWHPDLCKPLFFLDFVKDGTRRISYAASMGKTIISAEKKEEFGKLIKNIEVVSVREKDNAEVITQFTDKNIEVNIDPTFLFDADDWRKYSKKYPIKQPYILVYAIYWNKNLNKEVKELSRKTGLKVISISSGLDTVYANKKIYDADVGEFLWLIDNAEYVVTSSFHGVAFSTIFNKKFSAVINPKLPSRIAELTNLLDIPIVPIEGLLQEQNVFNYTIINSNIKLERERSLAYLSKELQIDE